MLLASQKSLLRWASLVVLLVLTAVGTAGAPAAAADNVATSGWETNETTATDAHDHSLGGGVVEGAGPGARAFGNDRNSATGNSGGNTPASERSSVQAAGANSSPASVVGNPAAVNIITGSGKLGDALGINRNGWRFGGVVVNNGSGILSGGLGPGQWAGQNLTVADLSFDTDKGGLWEGGLFGTQYLYHAGYGGAPVVNGIQQSPGSPNSLAGTVMGFNSLDNAPPIDRSELYQAWFRQEFFDKKLVMRIGKSVPTYDFANVVKPVSANNAAGNIPAVSGAILTPLYVNPTMLGIIPGYYNSSSGVVASFTPTDHFYMTYGFFDGNLALQKQTGLEGPHFDGHYFHIGEVGTSWTIGEDELPGRFGVGYWGQTGQLQSFSGPVNGAQGVYLFGSQCLYWESPGKNNNGLNGYYQFGSTNSEVVFTHRFFGCGLTYYGLLPSRDEDSFGFGMAWGRMTNDPDAGKAFYTGYGPGPAPLGAQEVILTWYYQIKVSSSIFVQPNLSYIPDPARVPGTPGAFPFTMQATMLF